MKKTYSKPQIVFDSFELSQSVAAGCEAITNQSLGTCPLKVEDIGVSLMLFTADVNACAPKVPDGSYDDICYHVPTEYNNVFAS